MNLIKYFSKINILPSKLLLSLEKKIVRRNNTQSAGVSVTTKRNNTDGTEQRRGLNRAKNPKR